MNAGSRRRPRRFWNPFASGDRSVRARDVQAGVAVLIATDVEPDRLTTDLAILNHLSHHVGLNPDIVYLTAPGTWYFEVIHATVALRIPGPGVKSSRRERRFSPSMFRSRRASEVLLSAALNLRALEPLYALRYLRLPAIVMMIRTRRHSCSDPAHRRVSSLNRTTKKVGGTARLAVPPGAAAVPLPPREDQ